MRLLLLCLLLLSFQPVWAQEEEKKLYIYGWYNEVPQETIDAFEKETGINVIIATYNDNEILYAKLKASPRSGFDLIMPSNYYVERMANQNMLDSIDLSQLPNRRYIPKKFDAPDYDPKNRYSIPYLWGTTGIYVNKKFHNPNEITRWRDLADPKYKNQLMLLNDAREVFSMALISNGLDPNSSNPKDIEIAYQFLLKLLPNIRVFNSDSLPAIFIDEDLTLGMAWNGDVFRGQKENADLRYVYPEDGFVIWVDCFAIPKYAPHPKNAHLFLNFILRPDISANATKSFGYATANIEAKKYLPPNMQKNPIIYPTDSQIEKGRFQRNLSQETLEMFANYWEKLKLAA